MVIDVHPSLPSYIMPWVKITAPWQSSGKTTIDFWMDQTTKEGPKEGEDELL